MPHFTYTLVYMKYTVCNMQNLCYLLFPFSFILSLVQFTRAHILDDDTNSTYFSSPFHASSLLHSLPISSKTICRCFSKSVSRRPKCSLERTRASSSNPAPDILQWLELVPVPVFGLWFSSHFQFCLPVDLYVIDLEFYQFLASEKHFTENRNTQRNKKCQERKLWHWRITDYLSQIS